MQPFLCSFLTGSSFSSPGIILLNVSYFSFRKKAINLQLRFSYHVPAGTGEETVLLFFTTLFPSLSYSALPSILSHMSSHPGRAVFRMYMYSCS